MPMGACMAVVFHFVWRSCDVGPGSRLLWRALVGKRTMITSRQLKGAPRQALPRCHLQGGVQARELLVQCRYARPHRRLQALALPATGLVRPPNATTLVRGPGPPPTPAAYPA